MNNNNDGSSDAPASGAAASDITHFSMDRLPERDRMAILREVIGRYFARMQLEPDPDTTCIYTGTKRSLPGLSLITSTCAGFSAQRTPAQIADGDDVLIFTISTKGTAHAFQLGRETSISPYEGVLMSAAERGTMLYTSRAGQAAVCLPRKTIVAAVRDPEALLARLVPRTEALMLLTSYISALDQRAMTSPELRQAFATHVTDLVILALGANSDAVEVARGRGLRAARLQAIKTDILAHLADERLSVTETARRHRVTPRYVQMLFESDGATFSEYVREQRLARACRMLTDATFAGWTISAIAFEAGFSNLSYFNRAFRSRYGATPSDLRAKA
jgi:AraC-like DNA-binding protein